MNQIIVGTNRRHVLRTFDGMSHEITYTGPLIPLVELLTLVINYHLVRVSMIKVNNANIGIDYNRQMYGKL